MKTKPTFKFLIANIAGFALGGALFINLIHSLDQVPELQAPVDEPYHVSSGVDGVEDIWSAEVLAETSTDQSAVWSEHLTNYVVIEYFTWRDHGENSLDVPRREP